MEAQLAVQSEELGYFAWGLGAVPRLGDLTEWTNPADVVKIIDDAFAYETAPIGSQREEPDLRYVDLVNERPSYPNFSLSTPAEMQYKADVELLNTPENDAAAYRLMRISFLAALSGVQDSLGWLTLLMLRSPMNRQASIAKFLHLATAGKIITPPPPPSRDAILQIVASVEKHDHLYQIRTPFSEIVAAYRQSH
ncbi:hypothetical protein GCM10010103_66490 [Streptomyces paradoxus]|uniref:Uncharacterized protein n=1 Tax=Streptomyces paradoxus TaxID=66375 RepID=A0A7W9WK72_9ACTN|nr:hypothetical protein [Streptomyces paradoxus]MBB6081862.1 hypothetical protein [Streptomyces paradoxus]